jgi:hypothetical protein
VICHAAKGAKSCTGRAAQDRLQAQGADFALFTPASLNPLMPVDNERKLMSGADSTLALHVMVEEKKARLKLKAL